MSGGKGAARPNTAEPTPSNPSREGDPTSTRYLGSKRQKEARCSKGRRGCCCSRDDTPMNGLESFTRLAPYTRVGPAEAGKRGRANYDVRIPECRHIAESKKCVPSVERLILDLGFLNSRRLEEVMIHSVSSGFRAVVDPNRNLLPKEEVQYGK